MKTNSPRTAEQYETIFSAECSREYPEVDSLERRTGFAVSQERLRRAARVLACPLKVSPPSWQHGRVIYALLRQHIQGSQNLAGIVLDIGTAKGFSATVLGWAVEDSGCSLEVVSVDLLNPADAVPRNSVAELERPLSVYEFTEPFISKNVRTTFVGGGSRELLRRLQSEQRRVFFAFVDGKHSFEAVSTEARAVSGLQLRGDVAVFDDVQIDGVMDAVQTLSSSYVLTGIRAGATRRYVVAVKK